jgi:hypothetical protein
LGQERKVVVWNAVLTHFRPIFNKLSGAAETFEDLKVREPKSLIIPHAFEFRLLDFFRNTFFQDWKQLLRPKKLVSSNQLMIKVGKTNILRFAATEFEVRKRCALRSVLIWDLCAIYLHLFD